MDTSSFYQSQQVLSLLSKYLDTENSTFLQDRFTKSLKDLNDSQCRICVLGVQGVGKSSFLNAILFGDILLPVDADETTCIPTEIHYGDNTTPKAVVVFSDGKRQDIVCSEKGLAQFAHQANNPGNRQKISHIEISYKNELLKKGIILVDLPGVGSITIENQKTTLNYIQNSSAAIFLLRTVPPMTRSESIFIQGALPLMNSVFWVQNQWTDESEEELIEGCDHNEDKLRHIAKKVHKPDEYIHRPIVVCVKQALDGKIDDCLKMIAESKLISFTDKIVAFADNWRERLNDQLRKDAKELIVNALVVAKENKLRYEKILSGEEDKAKEELEVQYQEANQIKDDNKTLIREVENYIQNYKQELQKNISSRCRIGSEDLRNKVRELIDNGLTGGARLTQAYNDCSAEINEEIFQELQPPFIELTQGTQQIIADLKPVSLSKTQIKTEGVFTDKAKGTAHYARAGVAAGATAGAAIGAFVGGPIGAVLGGLFGGLVGGFGGKQAAKVQVDRQRETAREELFSQIETFRKELEENYRKALNDFIRAVDEELRSWNKEQNDNLEQQYEAAQKDFLASQAEITEKLQDVIDDLNELNKLEQKLSE